MRGMSVRQLMEWQAFLQLQAAGKLQQQMEIEASRGAAALVQSMRRGK